MALISRNIKPRNEYQVWLTADLSVGDVLGVEETLGHPASYVTIEAIGGEVSVRFNVVQKIYKTQEGLGNGPAFPNAAFYTSAWLMGEKQVAKPLVMILEGDVYSLRNETNVRDIEIVSLAPITRITVS